MVPMIQNIFSKQEIQMVMAVLMDQIIDEIQIVAIEAVDEGQAWSMAVAETHDTLGPQRDNPGSQIREQLVAMGPDFPNGLPRMPNSIDLLAIGSSDVVWLPVLAVHQGRSYRHRQVDMVLRRVVRPVPHHFSAPDHTE